MKTNKELTTEAGFYQEPESSLIPDAPEDRWFHGKQVNIENLASLVEQRQLAKLLEGVGEPVNWEQEIYELSGRFVTDDVLDSIQDIHAYQLAAAVLAERERFVSICEGAVKSIGPKETESLAAFHFYGGFKSAVRHIIAAIRGATT